MTLEAAVETPIQITVSGPTGGVIAAKHTARLLGMPNLVTLDMGGTSTDVSTVVDGKEKFTTDFEIEWGRPIQIPMIDIRSIGAGGGSLAWIDSAGSLHNGPQSAGADPGPACYGRGSTEPTNTDAHVVLGHLGSGLAGGNVRLDPALAEAAVRKGVAEKLGLELHDAAEAILKVADANMADAVRLISISRGYDPRDFALVAFGGAGPLHGASLARELSVPTVIVPPNPGVTSALGCLLVDIQHDLGGSYIRAADDADPAAIEEAFAALEREAWERMHHEGVADRDVVMERSIDMMYRGQWRSLAVPAGRPIGSVARLVAAFHALHQREYNFRRDDAPVDLYRLNLRAVGIVPKAAFREHAGDGRLPAPIGRRPVWFDSRTPVDTPVYRRDDLVAGTRFAGPAIIEQLDSTTVVPPGVATEVDRFLNIIMRVGN